MGFAGGTPWRPELNPFAPAGHYLEATMKALLAAILGASFLMLGGCNTVEGVGKDVKATGAAVEKAAQKSKSSTY